MFKKLIMFKLKSKKGYVFTYEALAVAFVFLIILTIMFMSQSHNTITFLNEKKDIDYQHKSLLLTDYYLKKYEFGSDSPYYNNSLNFTDNILNKIKGNVESFDPYCNFSEDYGNMYFIIFPSKNDGLLKEYLNDLSNYWINLSFNSPPVHSNITMYSNVVNRSGVVNEISALTNAGNNKISKMVIKRVVYIPTIELDSAAIEDPNLKYKSYGASGDIIYVYLGPDVYNSRMVNGRILMDNRNMFPAYPDWECSIPLTVVNPHNSHLSNYDVKFVFDSRTLIENNEMNETCNDIRFIDNNGNELNYWIEPQSINTTHTIVWIKMDLAPYEHKQIYMLYGNPQAESESNGEDTFLFFDNFSEGEINDNKWDSNFDIGDFGNWDLFKNDSYPNNKLNYTYLRLNYSAYNGGNAEIYINTTEKWNSNTAMKIRAKFHRRYEEWLGYYQPEFDKCIISNYHWGGRLLRFDVSKIDDNHINYIVLPENLYDVWNTYEIQRNGINNVNLIINDSQQQQYVINNPNDIYPGDLPVSINVRSYDNTLPDIGIPDDEKNGYIDVDWVFVRPYVQPEPTIQNNTYEVVFTVNGKIFRKQMTPIGNNYDDVWKSLRPGLNEIKILHAKYPVQFQFANGNDVNDNFQTVTLSPHNVSIVVVR